MRFRSRPSSVLTGALAVYLLLFLVVLPFSHDCTGAHGHGDGHDHCCHAATPPDTTSTAADGSVGVSRSGDIECLACLFFAQVQTGLTPTAPFLAAYEPGLDRPRPRVASRRSSRRVSPFFPRGPPAV